MSTSFVPSTKQLQALIAVDEAGSISQAGRVAHLARTSIEYHLRGFERHFDAPLTVRDPRKTGSPVVLTPLGKQVADKARVALEAAKAVLEVRP